MEADN